MSNKEIVFKALQALFPQRDRQICCIQVWCTDIWNASDIRLAEYPKLYSKDPMCFINKMLSAYEGIDTEEGPLRDRWMATRENDLRKVSRGREYEYKSETLDFMLKALSISSSDDVVKRTSEDSFNLPLCYKVLRDDQVACLFKIAFEIMWDIFDRVDLRVHIIGGNETTLRFAAAMAV